MVRQLIKPVLSGEIFRVCSKNPVNIFVIYPKQSVGPDKSP